MGGGREAEAAKGQPAGAAGDGAAGVKVQEHRGAGRAAEVQHLLPGPLCQRRGDDSCGRLVVVAGGLLRREMLRRRRRRKVVGVGPPHEAQQALHGPQLRLRGQERMDVGVAPSTDAARGRTRDVAAAAPEAGLLQVEEGQPVDAGVAGAHAVAPRVDGAAQQRGGVRVDGHGRLEADEARRRARPICCCSCRSSRRCGRVRHVSG